MRKTITAIKPYRNYLWLLLLCSVCYGYSPTIKSFNNGQVSPLLEARIEYPKYSSSLRTAENVLISAQGPVNRRPGTKYIAEVKDSSDVVRLIPFEYSTDDTYIMEFGDQYIRFFRNGGQILDGVGTENLSALDNIVAHWLLNELSAVTVADDDGGTHDGTASVDISTLSTTGKVGYGCFDLDNQYLVEIADHSDFSFTDGSDDSPFSIEIGRASCRERV